MTIYHFILKMITGLTPVFFISSESVENDCTKMT